MGSGIGHWRLRAGLFLLLALLGPAHGVFERLLGSCTVAALECGNHFEEARELDNHSHPDCHAEQPVVSASSAQVREVHFLPLDVPGAVQVVPGHRGTSSHFVSGRSSPDIVCQGFFHRKVGLQLYA